MTERFRHTLHLKQENGDRCFSSFLCLKIRSRAGSGMLKLLVLFQLTLLNACASMSPNQICGEQTSLRHCGERLVGDGKMKEYEGFIQRQDLASRKGSLKLPFKRYSSGNNRQAVFFLGGGPGVSNLKFSPPELLVDKYDVVVMEYRGVGESSILLQSPYFSQGLKKLNGKLNLAHAEKIRPFFARGFNDLVSQGIVFSDFSVAAIAEDLELARQQLGYERINIIAHSFGTRVASYYRSRYPKHTARSILFALNTPGGFIWQPKQNAAVWRRYQKALSKRDPEKASQLAKLLERPVDWPSSYLGLSVNPAKALFTAFMLSYNRRTLPYSMDALLSSQQSSSFSWLLFSASYDFMISGFNLSDLIVKAYNSDCDATAIQNADEQYQQSPFQSPSSVLFAGYREFASASGKCTPVHFQADYQNTLVVNGEFDPATPWERTRQLVPEERLLILENMGHADVFYLQQQASILLAMQFLDNGTVNDKLFKPVPLVEPKSIFGF